MGFSSIFAWKGLPEAGFAKKAVIDASRSFGNKRDTFHKGLLRN
jgi:hypothetical protein